MLALRRREIILKDSTKYFYITSNYETENALGIVKATLKQFTIFTTGNAEDVLCKLYQTDEGNWYDLITNNSISLFLLTSIKIAIDESEQGNHLLKNHI